MNGERSNRNEHLRLAIQELKLLEASEARAKAKVSYEPQVALKQLRHL